MRQVTSSQLAKLTGAIESDVRAVAALLSVMGVCHVALLVYHEASDGARHLIDKRVLAEGPPQKALSCSECASHLRSPFLIEPERMEYEFAIMRWEGDL